MIYEKIIEDSAVYVDKHIKEELTAQSLGNLYSCTAGYFSYIFSCYCQIPLNCYIDKVRLQHAANEFLSHSSITDVVNQYRYESPERFQMEFEKEYGISLEGFLKRGEPVPPVQLRRQVKAEDVQIEYKTLKPLTMAGYPIVQEEKEEKIEYNPIGKAVMHYGIKQDGKKSLERIEEDEVFSQDSEIAMWWHDPACNSYYLMGPICKDRESVPEDMTAVSMPASEYAVFSWKNDDENNLTLEETIKNLLYYAYHEWLIENESKIDKLGYTYELYQDGKAYLYLPLLRKEEQVPKEKVYGVDTWTKYIDRHIAMNLTTAALAETFHYSPTHFRRVFQEYYDMTVSDYIRKRRLQMVAEEIRSGAKYKNLAAKYNFKTYAGFARAFEKEFNMPPSAYSKGVFEVVDLEQYYKEYKGKLIISIVDIKEIKMIGHTVIPDRGDEVDIPSQIYYWMDKDFPCLKNTRFSCNKRRREDKIAMWYHEPDFINIEYILGPVVEEFSDDIPEEMIQVTIDGGKYAIFETGNRSDKDNIPETLRMFSRCVFYGWIKEHRAEVDLMRFTFERYIDNKVYIYVPIKNK